MAKKPSRLAKLANRQMRPSKATRQLARDLHGPVEGVEEETIITVHRKLRLMEEQRDKAILALNRLHNPERLRQIALETMEQLEQVVQMMRRWTNTLITAREQEPK